MTPERLKEIRKARAAWEAYGAGCLDSSSDSCAALDMIRDLLAHVDALEAFIRELPDPLPEQILHDPAGALLRMRRLMQARADFLADRRVLGEKP